MTIGFNAILVDHTYIGGVNTYAFGLLEGFINRLGSNSLVIFCSTHNKHLFDKYKSSNTSLIVYDDSTMRYRLGYRITQKLLNPKQIKSYQKAHSFFYKTISQKINNNCDIIYTPTTILFPYETSVPSVVSMHDIQHTHFPEFFTQKELDHRNVTFSLSAQHADIIQASSTYIKNDLLKNFNNLKKSQVAVIPEGVNIENFKSAKQPEQTKKKYKLPADFILYPAQMWHHKDHLTLLKALNQYREKHNKSIPLVLTGSKQSSAEAIFKYIEEYKMTQDVYYLGKVPYDDLIDLFHLSKVLISTSLHESSCLPVLEAVASNTAVIASDIEPNIEMNETLQLNLFKKGDADSLCNVLHQCYNDESLLRNQIQHNSENIHKYSWNKIAEQYLDLFEEVISRK